MKLLSLYSIVIRLLCAMPLIAASPIIGDAAITVAPLEKRVPAAVYGPGKFGAFSSGNPFISFDNNVRFYLQNTDANLVVYNNGAAGWASGATRAGGCTPSTFCQLSFQNDGNLVVYAGTTAIWNSQTGGRGAAIQIQNVQPYIFMINGQGTIIWSSGGPTRPGYNPCDNGCCRNGLYVC